jgi:hypothetical protein
MALWEEPTEATQNQQEEAVGILLFRERRMPTYSETSSILMPLSR